MSSDPDAPTSNRPATSDRRQLFRLGATAAAGAAVGSLVASCAPGAKSSGQAPAVVTNPQVRWRLASSFPHSLDTIHGIAVVFADRLAAMSDGRFTVQVSAAGELVPALQVLDAVQLGTVQIGQTASYYFTGKNPALAFDTALPFGLTARQQTSWLLEGGGLELMRKVFADFGIINFVAGNTGAQMGGWFKREVSTVADLGGLKIRLPGLGGQVLDRLGASVQVLPPADIFPALERGAIDAADWSGPYDDEKLGLHQTAPFYYYPGFWEPGPSLSYLVNRKAWDQLPKSYQQMFETAATESAALMVARYDARNPPALERLIAGGTQLRPFSREILAAAQSAAFEIYEAQAAADASYRALYESWKAFRSASFAWFARAEKAYDDFAFPAV
jgi:TRAP-type mannitol/chloroaromatic compound transport system substrate-binding protein